MFNIEKIIGLMKYFADRGNEENKYYRMVIHYAGEDVDTIILAPEKLEFNDNYLIKDTTLIFRYTKSASRNWYYYIDLDKISRIIIEDENGGEYE